MAHTIRPARPADVELIAPWTQDTFTWGDYVASSLPSWIQDSALHVLVAADEHDRPTAMARVQMLSSTEAWLDAARVHPESQRQGLGSLLNDSCVQWAGDHGARVARLVVEDDNDAAQNQVHKLGYRKTSTWVCATADVDPTFRANRSDRLDTVGRFDVDPAWMFWSTSEISEAGRGLIPSGWLWRRATVGDVNNAAKSQRLFSNPAGWLILEDRTPETLDVTWVATSANDFPRLISGISDLAADRGIEKVMYRVPQTGWSGEAMARSGMDPWEVYVYGKAV